MFHIYGYLTFRNDTAETVYFVVLWYCRHNSLELMLLHIQGDNFERATIGNSLSINFTVNLIRKTSPYFIMFERHVLYYSEDAM